MSEARNTDGGAPSFLSEVEAMYESVDLGNPADLRRAHVFALYWFAQAVDAHGGTKLTSLHLMGLATALQSLDSGTTPAILKSASKKESGKDSGRRADSHGRWIARVHVANCYSLLTASGLDSISASKFIHKNAPPRLHELVSDWRGESSLEKSCSVWRKRLKANKTGSPLAQRLFDQTNEGHKTKLPRVQAEAMCRASLAQAALVMSGT